MFHHTHLTRLLATGMAIGVGAFPAVAHGNVIAVAGSGAAVHTAGAAAAAGAHHDRGAQTGFDWADAGVGAGGAIVLVAGCAGGAAAMRRRWTIRPA